MQKPHQTILPAQPEQQSAPESLTSVSGNRHSNKVRDVAELMSAAMCRGDVEVAARYWNEYRAMVGAA